MLTRLLAMLLLALASFSAQGRERQLHGYGPEGEEVVLQYTTGHPQCHGKEMLATARWPDGTTRTGCWMIYYPSYRVTVRWRQEENGRPKEWTVEYQSLTLRYVARQ